MRLLRQVLAIASVSVFLVAANAGAQVLEATLYGVVHDSTGAILPGVSVVVTHQGTNLVRETVSDERGEFALPALPPGPYAIKIELAGFKTYNSQGLTLGAGQTVRQTYALEVGNHGAGGEYVEVVIPGRCSVPVDAAHNGLRAVDDQELNVVDGEPLDREAQDVDPALLELGPDGAAAALGGVLDGGHRDAPIVRVEQHRRQVEPLKFIQLELDRVPRLAERGADGVEGGRPIRLRKQPVRSCRDRRRDDRLGRGHGGDRGRWGTTRRTGGGQQRQEEEGQPEAAGRAVHAGMLLHICVSVNASTTAGCAENWRYNSAALASMKAFLGIVELVLALLVMLGVLLQTPKASGLGGTIGGGGDTGGGYRTKRGLEKNLFYATIGLVVLFVVISVVYIRVG